MGTNYYLEQRGPCGECGRTFAPLHIGKSSAGWCFSLHVIPESNINSLEDWEREWAMPGTRIVDEYNDTVSVEEMRATITERLGKSGPHAPHWYTQNSAIPGPNGLARSALGSHCVGHGPGTWDLTPGEFL